MKKKREENVELPAEILLPIFSFFQSPKTLAVAREVCRQWKNVADSEELSTRFIAFTENNNDVIPTLGEGAESLQTRFKTPSLFENDGCKLYYYYYVATKPLVVNNLTFQEKCKDRVPSLEIDWRDIFSFKEALTPTHEGDYFLYIDRHEALVQAKHNAQMEYSKLRYQALTPIDDPKEFYPFSCFPVFIVTSKTDLSSNRDPSITFGPRSNIYRGLHIHKSELTNVAGAFYQTSPHYIDSKFCAHDTFFQYVQFERRSVLNLLQFLNETVMEEKNEPIIDSSMYTM